MERPAPSVLAPLIGISYALVIVLAIVVVGSALQIAKEIVFLILRIVGLRED